MAEYDGTSNPQSGRVPRNPPREGAQDNVPATGGGTDAERGTPQGMARTGGSGATDNRRAQGEDVQAGQEGDRAAATLDNQREGYGGPSGSRQGRSTDVGESARDVARRNGQDDA